MRVLIICDNIEIYQRIVNIIKEHNMPGVVFEYRHSPGSSPMATLPEFLDQHAAINVKENVNWIVEHFDLVISAHCKQFFPASLVHNIRCLNIHPGYNPINRGWFPQVFAIIHGLPIGATIHEMDEKLDHGPIIARKFVEKEVWDTSLTLYQKVIAAEMELFDQFFASIIKGTYLRITPEPEGNFFSKKNFDELLEFDLSETASFYTFYDRLRALSHGNYKNAYFIDPESGKKVMLKLEVSHE